MNDVSLHSFFLLTYNLILGHQSKYEHNEEFCSGYTLQIPLQWFDFVQNVLFFLLLKLSSIKKMLILNPPSHFFFKIVYVTKTNSSYVWHVKRHQ